MSLSKKIKFILAAFLLGILFCVGACGSLQEKTTLIELFVFAPCESCNEEEKFYEEVRLKLAEAGIKDFECRVYNAYKESGASYFEEISKESGQNITIKNLPVAVVEGEVFFGTYDRIGEDISECLQGMGKNDGKKELSGLILKNNVEQDEIMNFAVCQDISNVGDDDTAMLLFVTGACENCSQAEDYINSILTSEHYKLYIYNIMEDENAAVIRKLMNLYEVPDNMQQVPLLFFKTGFLSGADSIRENALGRLESREENGTWEKVTERVLDEKSEVRISKIKLALTGFINGLNPCGISMLLMVLSVLLMSKKSFFKGSLTYLGGKFLTYLLLGFTFGLLFSVIEGRIFTAIRGVLNIIFAVLSLGFGIFYFMDFVHVLRKDYGKERLRLPERFRRWNHSKIKKLAEVKDRFWYPMLFLLGAVISAGEFMCTGQVYLATLLYMARQNETFNGEIAGNLLTYLTAMCVPMLILTVFAAKGKNVMSASHFSLKLLPYIKLAYSIFFFALFVSLLF